MIIKRKPYRLRFFAMPIVDIFHFATFLCNNTREMYKRSRCRQALPTRWNAGGHKVAKEMVLITPIIVVLELMSVE